jgi:DNA-directed RNA polymerase subunit RPC12/RpoP
LSTIYEVGDDYNSGYDWCVYCETCQDDEIKPHEYFESSSETECFVCHNKKCMHSFSEYDIEEDEEGEWHCPECNFDKIMKHVRCQCDEPTASGTVYRVHDSEGNSNCWPTYGYNSDKRVFECTRCSTQFGISLHDTTEDTETHKATRCENCNCKELSVKDVKFGDTIPTPHMEWFD